MFTPRKNSLPSPSLEDSFFPLSSSSSVSLSFALPSTASSPSGSEGIETDLILAAELGQALLEKNEELAASLEQSEREVEVLQQEKHVLQRKLEMNELTSGQREAELAADLAALRAELDKYHNQGRDRRRDESEQLTQLANHNQRLVEQLAEAVTLEHSLRTELRSLREEMEESSFSRNINFTQLENIQAENRVLLGRLTHMEAQLKGSEEDSERLRTERDRLRERLSEVQMKLREKEAEIEQEQGVVFELRTLNRSLQQKALNLGEENILDSTHTQPLSLLSEIQQSQAKEALLAHSTVLQARDEEIQTLTEKLQSQQEELDALREEIKPFRSSPGTPSYSSLESELATVRQEKESLTQQLLNTIKHKVALSQELDAWQEDMRLVINQQVQQREEERQREASREKDNGGGLQRSKSLRLKGDGGKGFFSFFKDK
ncbi:BICD family-like cargo adapter 2 Bicaudal D-related protein 2 [Larimichthys crocea]|uniref:BICD family-like cargo adapter 2 n=1 Tax=Larimichthys crocea TaxID=215358 RepID=A0A6G0HWI2_LARCR|nr:BICD family-like cargo adapter 2 isoform X1 [Larimichthys crocea]XP_019108767.2 BICD family-like cargo adapter 2 isoform X1 [Larimichthys crocea]KAE8283540.1 BICD family-like cargo adapter 2 Bicaudal D-related protein 2 [Larimichthys crocea]